MAVADELRKVRENGYKPGAFEASTGENGNDPDEANQTSRIIKLSDEEVKGLEPYQVKPGEEVILEVSGNLEGDHFHVMTVKYANGKEGDDEPMLDSEKQMADMVAKKVQPNLQISPS